LLNGAIERMQQTGGEWMSEDVQALLRRLVEEELELTSKTGGLADGATQARAWSGILREARAALLRSDEAAKEQEGVLQALLESSSDLVIYSDVAGLGVFVSKNVAERYGFKVGQDWIPRSTPLIVEELRAAFREVVRTHSVQTLEGPSRLADGRMVWLARRLAPVLRGGRLEGVLMVAQDITEQHEAEAELKVSDRLAVIGAIASGIAHEINNPLAALIADVEVALEEVRAAAGKVSPQAGETLEGARAAALRVRDIVRDMRAISRADEDKRVPVSVERVLDSALKLARDDLRQRGTVVKEYGAVPRVRANGLLLGQAFLSLILNAAHSIPEGNPERNQVRVRTEVDAEARVLVTIVDTGKGMSPEVLQNLFAPGVTNKAGPGGGLGLSICQHVIAGIGGTIDVRPAPGQGNEIRVSLPALPADE
jgi:PAS domain S-box-containing protein